MQIRMRWTIWADMTNQTYDLPDWLGKTLYQCYDMPDWDIYLLNQRWLVESHMNFSEVPVCNDDFPQQLSCFSFSSSTLPSPRNTQLCHCSLSLHAIIKSWHRAQYILSTSYTEYSVYRVQYSWSTTYTAYCIIRWLTVSSSQPVFDLSADHIVLNSLHHHYYETFNEQTLSFCSASLPNYHFEIDHLQSVLQSGPMMTSRCISTLTWSYPPTVSLTLYPCSLQVGTIKSSKCSCKLAPSHPSSESLNSHDHSHQVSTTTASKCISQLAWSQPPSVSLESHDSVLQDCMITASKCIFKLAKSQPPSVFPKSLDHGLKCISKFTRSRCGESWMQTSHHQQSAFPRMGSERNTRDTVARASGAYGDSASKWWDIWPWWITWIAWIYEHLARVYEDPHKLRGSKNAWQEWMIARAEEDGMCILCNEMMSIYPRVSQIYNACCWVSVIPVSLYVYI